MRKNIPRTQKWSHLIIIISLIIVHQFKCPGKQIEFYQELTMWLPITMFLQTMKRLKSKEKRGLGPSLITTNHNSDNQEDPMFMNKNDRYILSNSYFINYQKLKDCILLGFVVDWICLLLFDFDSLSFFIFFSKNSL